jgi:hypothetical protein
MSAKYAGLKIPIYGVVKNIIGATIAELKKNFVLIQMACSVMDATINELKSVSQSLRVTPTTHMKLFAPGADTNIPTVGK